MEQFLKSRYKTGKKISENPYSLTYQGTYLSNEKPLIIKIYKRAALNSTLIKIIRQKIKEFSLISHHGIAKIIDGDYGWQGFYYVREYLEGKSLREILNAVKTVDVEKAVQIIQDVCEALSAVHQRNLIHGAVSPNNIIISSQKIVKLTDFVVEGQIKEALPQKANYVNEGARYLSPEEILGECATPASDIYAVALLLYEMLTGRLPFDTAENHDALKLALQKIKTDPLPLTKINPTLPKIFEDILNKALQRDPLLRFATIDEFSQSLKNKTIIARLPIPEQPTAHYNYDTDKSKPAPKETEHIQIPQQEKEGVPRLLGGWLVKLLLLAVLAGLLLAAVLNLVKF